MGQSINKYKLLTNTYLLKYLYLGDYINTIKVLSYNKINIINNKQKDIINNITKHSLFNNIKYAKHDTVNFFFTHSKPNSIPLNNFILAELISNYNNANDILKMTNILISHINPSHINSLLGQIIKSITINDSVDILMYILKDKLFSTFTIDTIINMISIKNGIKILTHIYNNYPSLNTTMNYQIKHILDKHRSVNIKYFNDLSIFAISKNIRGSWVYSNYYINKNIFDYYMLIIDNNCYDILINIITCKRIISHDMFVHIINKYEIDIHCNNEMLFHKCISHKNMHMLSHIINSDTEHYYNFIKNKKIILSKVVYIDDVIIKCHMETGFITSISENAKVDSYNILKSACDIFNDGFEKMAKIIKSSGIRLTEQNLENIINEYVNILDDYHIELLIKICKEESELTYILNNMTICNHITNYKKILNKIYKMASYKLFVKFFNKLIKNGEMMKHIDKSNNINFVGEVYEYLYRIGYKKILSNNMYKIKLNY